MEDESKKNELSKQDENYLNSAEDLFPTVCKSFIEGVPEGAVSDGLDGISYSKYLKVIEFDESEIKSLKKKKEGKDELTSDQQMKLSIHDIQSGRFKNFFKTVNEDLDVKKFTHTECKNKHKPKLNNETGKYE